MRRRGLLYGLVLSLPTTVGCLNSASPSVGDSALTVVATTTIYDSGLLDPITSGFEDRFGASVDVIARGTGAALELGRRGDCDVVMMHARSLEDEFLRDGYGINRRTMMASPFMLVGPDHDPAGVAERARVTEAFRAIAETESPFVSRADRSGTHLRERTIWEEVGIDPSGEWYHRAGTGMGNALIQADELDAYVLTVRATMLAMQSELALSNLLSAPFTDVPPLLANPYGIAAINPAHHDHVAYDLAMAFIGYITSPMGQDLIEGYAVDGRQLFRPAALSESPDFQEYVPEGWEPSG